MPGLGIGIGMGMGVGMNWLRRAILAALALPNADHSAFPNEILLRKLRDDYPEFAVYTPISEDGMKWVRWYFTNRLSPGNAGCVYMNRATLANLFASDPQAPPASNMSAETAWEVPAVARGTADASSRSGTWTAAGTVGGMPDITYSTVTGDYVEYQLTGVTRIAARHYGTTNGCKVSVYITDGASEIPAGQYALVGLLEHDRQAGRYQSPLAKGLDPAKTYTVRMTRDASSDSGDRLYDGGCLGYLDRAFDATGLYGPFYDQALGAPSVTTRATRAPGSIIVYELTDATRIGWRCFKNSTGGLASLAVYDSTGAEIDSGLYITTTVDTYSASASAPTNVLVADRLEKGTYYLHITTLPEKNASATEYRVHDYGAIGYDTTTAGTVGSDPFDDGEVIDSNQSSGDRTVIGGGMLERAIKCRKTTDAAGSAGDNFVGGSHGHETSPTDLAFEIDGSPIDFDGAANGFEWTGAVLNLTFSTTLNFSVDDSAFADATYSYTLSRDGYEVEDSVTSTTDAYITVDYCMMLNSLKASAPDAFEGVGVAGVMLSDASDHLYAAKNAGNNTPHYSDFRADCIAVIGSRHVATAEQLNWSAIASAVSGTGSTDELSFVQDRSDSVRKGYNRTFSGPTTGTLVSSGYSRTAQKRYRVKLL